MKIGNPLHKGISGGQAKRTNIGIALITSPRVLFLDEPTSGLDSFTANEVMTVVQGLAADGERPSRPRGRPQGGCGCRHDDAAASSLALNFTAVENIYKV